MSSSFPFFRAQRESDDFLFVFVYSLRFFLLLFFFFKNSNRLVLMNPSRYTKNFHGAVMQDVTEAMYSNGNP